MGRKWIAASSIRNDWIYQWYTFYVAKKKVFKHGIPKSFSPLNSHLKIGQDIISTFIILAADFFLSCSYIQILKIDANI